MWRCRGIYWRTRWAITHRAWNKLQHALHGNTAADEVDVDVTAVWWNARGLPADAGHPKWQWIFEQAEHWAASVVAVCEVEGRHDDFKALRAAAATLLPG